MNIARQLLLGRYFKGNSPVHKIDPRIKILFLFLISCSVFFISEIEKLIYHLGLLVFIVFLSRIKTSRFIKGIVPILWLIVFTFIMHFIIPPRRVEYAALISMRLIVLFSWASVLTITTPAGDLGNSIAWFIKPLKIIGISPEYVSFTFSLSLRFFPIILEEADSILKAQKSRINKLSLREKIESFCTTFMIRVLKRARGIEVSMTNRNIGKKNLAAVNRFTKLSPAEIIVVFFGISLFGIITFI
ncbi:MAG: energy-coupling factor transporter transmembrane component T family protein [Elusimicrobiota bacterium]